MNQLPLEEIAEARITSELHRAGFLVAKPKPDKMGTDLLAFVEMTDGVKFCRIQCKGRSVANSGSSLEIAKDYVSEAFIVILYIENQPDGELYCFFQSDIEQWNLNKKSNEYTYSIPKKSYRETLEFYKLNSEKMQLIRRLIMSAEISGEFKHMVYGRGCAILKPVSSSGTATVTKRDFG